MFFVKLLEFDEKAIFSEKITVFESGVLLTWQMDELSLVDNKEKKKEQDFDEFYLNDISIRDKIEEKLDIRLGKIRGKLFRVENGTYMKLESNRFNIEFTGKVEFDDSGSSSGLEKGSWIKLDFGKLTFALKCGIIFRIHTNLPIEEQTSLIRFGYTNSGI